MHKTFTNPAVITEGKTADNLKKWGKIALGAGAALGAGYYGAKKMGYIGANKSAKPNPVAGPQPAGTPQSQSPYAPGQSPAEQLNAAGEPKPTGFTPPKAVQSKADYNKRLVTQLKAAGEKPPKADYNRRLVTQLKAAGEKPTKIFTEPQ